MDKTGVALTMSQAWPTVRSPQTRTGPVCPRPLVSWEPSKAGARAMNTAGDTEDALKTFKRKDYTECASAFLVAQTVKTLPAVWETRVQSLDLEDPLEKQMATHSCVLAWKIPWTEEPGRLQSMGPRRVGQD